VICSRVSSVTKLEPLKLMMSIGPFFLWRGKGTGCLFIASNQQEHI